MASNYPRGSEWRKWDLHVHTPFSYLNNQFGSPEDTDTWDNYVRILFNKAIEKNIAVIGITDYFFIDGYKKVKNEYLENEDKLKSLFGNDEAKLQAIRNILVLPNIEFRLNKLVGPRRINFHVIFSNEVSINDIENNFLNEIKFVYESGPQTEDEKRPLIKQNLISLGQRLKLDHHNFATKPDIEVGMMNTVVNDEEIVRILTNKKSIFEGKYLLFIPSDEDLSKISWDGQDHQTRKVLIQKSDGLFASNPNTIQWALGYKHLGNNREEQINNFINEFKSLKPCIWGSDAHHFDKLFNPDQNRHTWIKADPTFEGLKQIIYEPEERVYIGDEPEILKRIRENKTKFISVIKIDQTSGYNEEKGIWFKDVEILLNPGLVAIIGNKGNGKSALTDIVALCGNSHRYDDFSFLKEEKFLKDGLAKNFEAELNWESDECVKKNLGERTDPNSPERVRYLPQNFFERLTNNLETYDFEKTLEEVVFSYIPNEERLGRSNFQELIEYKKELADKEINDIVSEIKKINEKIIGKESKNHPDYKRLLEEKLKIKNKELDEHEKIKPKEVPDPTKDPNLSEDFKKKQTELLKLSQELEKTEDEIKQVQTNIKNVTTNIEEFKKIKKELEYLKKQIENYINSNKQRFKDFGLKIEDIIKFEINFKSIDEKIKEQENDLKEKKTKLFSKEEIEENPNLSNDEKQTLKSNSLIISAEKLKEEIEKIKADLSEPQKRYQQYLEELRKWEEKKKLIEGDENTIDTIKWLKKELEYIDKQLNDDITKLRNERLDYSLQIFRKKKEIADIYSIFKNAVGTRIQQFQDILGEYKISIDVSLNIHSSFYDEFLGFIDQGRKGSFYGINEGKSILEKLIKGKDINNEDGIKSLLNDFIDYLENDKREEIKESDKKRYIMDQIAKRKEISNFYEYIFSLSYLVPTYELKLGDKNLIQLSPGERGALLIVFYLLLDKEDIPLIIDQPEENLDNKSVYKILRHFIKNVKKERQVIIVTHNPNLAIVGDAEQIIFVKIDKANKNIFSFESGSIENPIINKHASDILEGTLKAFDVRRLKYLRYNYE